MAENSKIEWTTHTFNIAWGCVKVSDGCKFCYADTLSNRYGHDVWGVNKPRRTFGTRHWAEPLKWNQKAKDAGERHRVFCSSMTDVFFDDPTLEQERPKLWALIEQTPHLDWLLLTKRPENIMQMIPESWRDKLPFNVWVGTSVEHQDAADERIPHLIEVPAVVRFLSCEPLLSDLDLTGKTVDSVWIDPEYAILDPLLGELVAEQGWYIDWVIVGGESGAKARPMNIEWARSIKDQCQKAGVPFFMKQLGGRTDKRGHLEDLPEDLRIREFPQPQQAVIYG